LNELEFTKSEILPIAYKNQMTAFRSLEGRFAHGRDYQLAGRGIERRGRIHEKGTRYAMDDGVG
jgi:hypothetical protein